MAGAREKGALWSWALELKGHEDGFSFDIYMKLVEEAVALRYPKKGDPSKGRVKLLKLKENEGWLVDQDSWNSGLTYVDSYENYKGDRARAGWVLNQDMAYVYRSLATYHNPIKVSVKEFDRTYNPNTDPGTMFSLGGPVASPGDRITIVCDASQFPAWEKIEVFNGAKKLGEVSAGTLPEITTSLDGSEKVYCLTALAADSEGTQKTSDPMHFFVRDPALGWESELPVSQFEGVKSNAGSMNVGKVISWAGYEPDDSVLVAYGLTGEMEAQFSSSDHKKSDFWKLIDGQHDRISLTQRENAAKGASFNFVLTHDCNMVVKAAYGADGIYLLLEINDDNDVAWPNEFAGTENEQFYLDFDAVDLLDGQPVRRRNK